MYIFEQVANLYKWTVHDMVFCSVQ